MGVWLRCLFESGEARWDGWTGWNGTKRGAPDAHVGPKLGCVGGLNINFKPRRRVSNNTKQGRNPALRDKQHNKKKTSGHRHHTSRVIPTG